MSRSKNNDYPKRGIVFAVRFTKNYLLHLIAKLLPSSALIHKLRGVKIGRRVHIGSCVHIDNVRPSMVHIEDDVTIGPNSMFFACSCHLTVSIPEVTENGDIYLKKGCFIGAGSIILPGVTIGEGAIIGAGTVVTKNVEHKYIVAGSPAKVIGKRR